MAFAWDWDKGGINWGKNDRKQQIHAHSHGDDIWMVKVKCPNCNALVEVGKRPAIGQRCTCQGCGSNLEVVWLYPIELDLWVERSPAVATGKTEGVGVKSEDEAKT